MALSMDAQLGLAMRFHVKLDNSIDLGGWSKCSGLGVKFEIDPIKEGGGNDYVILLPKRIDYPNITLQRAMTAKDSKKVQGWLSEQVDKFNNADIADYRTMGYVGATAKITLYDQHQKEVASWSLRNVFPAEWKAPDFDASTGKVAIETLTFVHEGFL